MNNLDSSYSTFDTDNIESIDDYNWLKAQQDNENPELTEPSELFFGAE